MKIAWFTPYCRESAIGRYSDVVVRELARFHQVSLWIPDLPTNRAGPVETISVRSCSPAAILRLQEYDLAVYNIGNHYPYHGLIYEFSQSFPGLTVLHDLVLHHFFASLYLEHQNDPEGYLKLLQTWYGVEIRHTAENALAGRRKSMWESDDVIRWPLFEPALENSLGVVTHSEFAREHVASRFAGPVSRLFLPYDKDQHEPKIHVSTGRSKILLLSVGQVNRNKRVHAVLNALAFNREFTSKVEYVILGPVDATYKTECDQIIAAGDLKGVVHFLGRVDDATLHAYLSRADICINLRFPVTETGSASLAEEMLHGKAVIVTNTGCYADVPDDCVYKVSPEQEESDLQQGLSRLIGDPGERLRMGQCAKAFAEKHFCPGIYIEELTPFMESVCSTAPLLRCIDRVGNILTTMGVSPEMQICDTISEQCLMFVEND